MAIQQLIYCSTATRPLNEDELVQLVGQARIHNHSQAITGLLFYDGGKFLQVLEGEPAVVDGLYAHIAHDPRHTGLTTVLDAPVPARNFPEWSMGFGQVDSAALARLLGYLDPRCRAALLPRTCNVQEVIADLLRDFMAEQPPAPRRPRAVWH
ncbi:BLUF domain-containing protein [Hymenobacter ruricola]|uniref:BLUF domain-containing protein n=1 Tax=Hymenobacter ruricola TaxID=2791023 RepID=A0ABS0IBT8_9BACT|nr:BLUF domain-containing protein [Hymenobacter ruricola]MBF9224113.1 BLUF domain-containing protein [Hymenobacter ruricola]